MLVLASHSPRRRELLLRAGIPFIVRPADIVEESRPGEVPEAHARRLARQKAEAVVAAPGEIILGADTIVVAGDRMLGKPATPAEAVSMLELLSGRTHEVITGICLRAAGRLVVDAERTCVRFVPMSRREIEEYVATGEPMDKAGAYGIQGPASKYIDRIEGCYFNVVGLPVARVCRRLRDLMQPPPPGAV